jgi:DNA-binding CsgD family transcriptional regulator
MGASDDVLFELIGDVQGLLALEEFRPGLVAALRRAVPTDWVSFNEIGPEPWDLVEPAPPAWGYEVFARLSHQNPLVAHMTTGSRPGAPVRISDVSSQEDFHALEIYRELYRPLGLEYQIAFTLPHEPPRLLGVALSRRRHDFTDAERDLLTRARPFLIQSYRNVLAFESDRRTADFGAMTAALSAAGLTRREAEALALVARGASSADAAATLQVGARTVDKHLQNALAKLGVRGRSRGAALAWQLTDAWEVDRGANGSSPGRAPGPV